MFASTQMGGANLGFPDVCMTPMPPSPSPIPIPYPNASIGPTTVNPVFNVLMTFAPAHNLMSTPAISMGDNPGIATGVASGTVMGPTRPVTGAFTCLVRGAPLARLTTINIQNSTNAPGCRIFPSQPRVMALRP
ncbi:MAG: DUF4150 domain-containing protein [Polyangiaceae bacterium]|nr:DUF4150 domain-containing protein [Polyangiaceae bacterium]